MSWIKANDVQYPHHGGAERGRMLNGEPGTAPIGRRRVLM